MSQLSRFETQNYTTLDGFLYILRLSPNITVGMFKVLGMPVNTPLLNTPMFHENLLDLNLSIDAGSLSYLLEYLTFPALRSLAIQSTSIFEVWNHEAFVAFLLRLRSSLQRLKLLDTAIESSELIETLHLTPSLKNLYIEGWSSTFLEDDFFLALMPRSDHQDGLPLCPKLETLTLRVAFTSTKSALADMLESRSNLDVQGFTRLRRVDVTLTWDWVGTCDYKRLEVLCEKGLVFFVEAQKGSTAWDEG